VRYDYLNEVASIPGPLPSLCYANRKTREECAPLLFVDTELVLLDVSAVHCLAQYLRHAPRALPLPSIHTLLFPPFLSWRPDVTHTAGALLTACHALRHVKIAVPHTVCATKKWTTIEDKNVAPGQPSSYIDVPVYRLHTKKEIINQMDLCCLVDCKTLETLTLLCQSGEEVARTMQTTREVVFRPLIVWVRKNLCCGGELRLVVEYVN